MYRIMAGRRRRRPAGGAATGREFSSHYRCGAGRLSRPDAAAAGLNGTGRLTHAHSTTKTHSHARPNPQCCIITFYQRTEKWSQSL